MHQLNKYTTCTANNFACVPYFLLITLFNSKEDNATPRRVQAFMTGPWRTSQAIKRAKMPGGSTFNDYASQLLAKCELDTRADTICVGSNFRILSTSGGVCDVKSFYDNYKVINDVPIARVATEFSDKSGATHILVINEALFFGSSMDQPEPDLPLQHSSFGLLVRFGQIPGHQSYQS